MLSYLLPRDCINCHFPLSNRGASFSSEQVFKILKSEMCFECSVHFFNELNKYNNFTKSKTQINNVNLFNLWDYRGEFKSLVLKAKTSYSPRICKVLGYLLAKTYLNTNCINSNKCVVVPTPCSTAGLKSRLYENNWLTTKFFCEFLCEQQSKFLVSPIQKRILKRLTKSKPQRLFTAKERKENIKNSLFLNFRSLNNIDLKTAEFVVIDDICTTGSTFEEISKLLLPINPKNLTFYSALKVSR